MNGGVLLDRITGRPVDSVAGEDDFYVGSVKRADRERLSINPHTRKPEFDVVEVLRKSGHDTTAAMLNLASREPGIKAMTRNKHYIGGRTTATAATARLMACNLWNPHSTSRIFIYEIWVTPTTAGSINLGVARTTARGTNTTTVAFAIANSIENDTAAPSGATLDLTNSVQPTVSAANLIVWMTPAAIGNGLILSFPDPITISPGSGMALITTQAAIFPVSDVTLVVGD